MIENDNLPEIEEAIQEETASSSNPFTGTYTVNVIRYHPIPAEGDAAYNIADNFFDVEQKTKVSIYQDREMAKNICTIAKPTTVKLYFFIVHILLKPNTDSIIIKPGQTQELLGISRNSLYAAISELCKLRLISRKTGKNDYWINPEYTFNGSRIKYIKIEGERYLNVVKRQKIVVSRYGVSTE